MEGLGQVRVDGCKIRESLVNYAIGAGVLDSLTFVVTEGWRWSCLPPLLWIPAFAGMTTCGLRTIEMALVG